MITVAFIQFVQPWLLASAAGAALIPLIIHLINRRRFRRVRWAAMAFLLSAAKRSARRIQLEQWSLLLIRMLLFLIMGLLLARPYFRQEALAAISGTRSHHVIVLDDSASMAAAMAGESGVAGRTEFERARQITVDLIRTMAQQDSVSVVTASAPANGLLAYECFDHRLAQDQILSLKQSYRKNDLPGALQLAERLVDESSAAVGNRIVYVISDQALHAWNTGGQESASVAADRSSSNEANAVAMADTVDRDAPAVRAARKLAEKARLLMIRASPASRAAASGPTGITELVPQSSLPGVNISLRFAVHLVNFGPAPVSQTSVEIKRDGQVLKEVPVESIGPHQSASDEFTIAIAQAGSHALEARLMGPTGMLPEAGVRRLALNLPNQIRVLLVDGKIGLSPFAGYSGYVRAALAAYSAGDRDPLFDTRVISDVDLPGEVLGDYALIVMAGVSNFSESVASRLTDYVANGGSILVFMGESVATDVYNQRCFADGRGWLPGSIQDFNGDASIENAGWSLKLPTDPHALASDFTRLEQSGLFQARVRKYARIIPFGGQPANAKRSDQATPDREVPAEVVFELENGDPLLLARPYGRGRSVLFASSANMDWCNLPAKGDFVSLVLNLAAYLCPPTDAGQTVEAGQRYRHQLSPSQAAGGVELYSPSEQAINVSMNCGAVDCLVESDPLDDPGFYRLQTDAGMKWIAVNFPATEADLRPVPGNQGEETWGKDTEWVDDAGVLVRRLVQGRTTEVGGPLLFLLIGFLLIEGWMAMRYGIHR